MLSSAARGRPSALVLAVAAVLGAPGGMARAGAAAGLDEPAPNRATALSAATHSEQVLYLDIVMDGRVVRPLARIVRIGERLLADPTALVEIGLVLPPSVPTDALGRVALDQVPGLRARYDQSLQQIVLTPELALRQRQDLGYRPPGPVSVRRDQGMVLDWDAYARAVDNQQTLALATAARWFGRLGSVQISGVSRAGDGGSDAYARLATTWSYSDPRRLWTWSAGDVVSGGLAWTRPVRLGGVQLRRNFGVRPDLIVYPLPQFSADATLPSAVELFVNNVRQYSDQVDAGPFVLSQFPRVVGAGQAVVVVTDALGRSTQTSVSLYVDYQRLAPGLTDFSLEAGVLRRGFGVDSNDYGQDPVASASWRRGLRNDFTVELHGETAAGLRVGGGGLAWSPLARFGVITANLTESRGDWRGRQHGVGYQWFGPEAGLDLYTQRASPGFRDLGTLDGGSPPLREQDRVSLWKSIPQGSLSLTWLRYRDHEDVPSRTISLGVNRSFGQVAFSANAFDDERAGRGVSLSLNVPLDIRHNSSYSVDHRPGNTDFTAAVRREAPYAGGWGWEAQARDSGDGQLSARWRGDVAEAWFGIDRVADRFGGFAQGNGSLVLMDGQGFASRRIGDAFAVVSTNGVPDVPILYENRVAGRTNDAGYLLLADLRGWQRNRLAIDPDALPASIEVDRIEQLVTPADRSGVQVKFALERVSSATVLLHDALGAVVEPGTRVRRADGGDAIVGFDGELWLERYLPGETLRWPSAAGACSVTAPVMVEAGGRVGPLICKSEVVR